MILACTLLASEVTAAAKVAIYVDGPIDESDRFVIESRVGTALRDSGLTILERTQNFLNMVTQEQSYQLSGEVSPKEICKLGERWGARAVISIYVVETRGTMVATVKIINITTGRVLSTISNHKACNTIDDLIVFASTLGTNIKREIQKHI